MSRLPVLEEVLVIHQAPEQSHHPTPEDGDPLTVVAPLTGFENDPEVLQAEIAAARGVEPDDSSVPPLWALGGPGPGDAMPLEAAEGDGDRGPRPSLWQQLMQWLRTVILGRLNP